MRVLVSFIICLHSMFQVNALPLSDDVEFERGSQKRCRDERAGEVPSFSQDSKRHAGMPSFQTEKISEELMQLYDELEFLSNYCSEATSSEQVMSSQSSSSVALKAEESKPIQVTQTVQQDDYQIINPSKAVSVVPVRLSTLQQHREFIRQAFEDANERIVFCSPFINFDSRFLSDFTCERIQGALDRGVQVVFVIGVDRYINRFKGHFESVNNHYLFRIICRSNFHNKTVIVDNRIGEGSFNWFSATRDLRSRYLNHEATLVYEGPGAEEMIDTIMHSL